MTVSAFRYRAFVSYSHRDQNIARWLHRALESYRVPKRLVGRETATGIIGKRLGAIFRDRDELPVAADLSGQINDALAATQFLIVLCSTASAQSKWVNQEVINFKRLKGEDSIIAVILDGEPFASNIPGRDTEECFAPALRFRVATNGTLSDQPAEPIAADLRPDKDSRRLVKLKIIAGLLGLGLDELVRRENQRRTQRLFWLSTGMAAGMAVMAVLTATAIQSRNEAVSARNDAERQKTQAEDLIEFMLGDLRKKLEPVGRLDVLDSVGEKALTYFGSLKPEELDADTLGRRARALHMLGELEDLRGNFDEARRVFAEAKESTAALLEQNPTDPKRLYDHSQSIYWLGYIDWRRGDKHAAELAFEQYKAKAEALTTFDPGNIDWKKEQGYAYSNIGTFLFQGHQFSQARESFAAAKLIFSNLAGLYGGDQSIQIDLAKTMSWLSDCLGALGSLEGARAERLAELDIYNSVLKNDPLNTMIWDYSVLSRIALGRLDVDTGNVLSAISHYRTADALAQKLVGIEPANAAWTELAVMVQLDLSEALLYRGDVREAQLGINRALLASADFSARPADFIDFQLSTIVRANILMAKSLLMRKEHSSVLKSIDAPIRALEKFKVTHADDEALPWLEAQTLLIKGDALAGENRKTEAEKLWLQGSARVSSRTERSSFREKIIQLNLAERQKDYATVESLTAQLSAAGVRHPDFLSVRDRVSASDKHQLSGRK